MIDASLKQLAAALATRQISSSELAALFLDRIEALNPRLNAFITIDRARTLAEARAADARLAAGEAAPLLGIPIAHKDIFCADGWRTTCGSKMLANFTAPYDATVIRKFKEAGTVCLGKTNMDEFAMGSSNETSFFGAVKNPWDEAAGSIRQPASHCGISGLKPTYGVCSRYGMIAFASSLDQAGPMAASAEDCALLMSVMAGFDERDSTSLQRVQEDYSRDLDKPLAGLKIGLPREFFAEGLSAEVAHAIETAIAEYKKLGAQTVEVSLPNMGLSVPVYYVLAPAEASSNLSRFDGVRYGHRASEYRDLLDMYEKTRAEGFGAEVKRRIMIGTYVLSHGYYDAYYLQAQRIRRLIAADFAAAFKACDVILGPTAPTPAFNFGEKAADPVAMYLSDIYTIAVNLAGLPGMSIPCGFSGNGRPIGLQLIGDLFAEAKLLNVAHQYQLNTDWHARMPEALK
jgi:aspartyl-tRNA(Asn)/glutamyl-tRNA(Gln) amidotransferase subunit A